MRSVSQNIDLTNDVDICLRYDQMSIKRWRTISTIVPNLASQMY